jgi:hypothetical protein
MAVKYKSFRHFFPLVSVVAHVIHCTLQYVRFSTLVIAKFICVEWPDVSVA